MTTLKDEMFRNMLKFRYHVSDKYSLRYSFEKRWNRKFSHPPKCFWKTQVWSVSIVLSFILEKTFIHKKVAKLPPLSENIFNFPLAQILSKIFMKQVIIIKYGTHVKLCFYWKKKILDHMIKILYPELTRYINKENECLKK